MEERRASDEGEHEVIGRSLDRVLDALRPVESEEIELFDSVGRVLADPVVLDRPSPACDVSAMDGYALRLSDLALGTLPILGESTPGRAVGGLGGGTAMRVFTGAMIPAGAEVVIPRERLEEGEASITLPPGLEVRAGQFIRRTGENAPAGAIVLDAGRVIDAPALAAMASVGLARVRVRRPLRVGILVTGGEVREVEAPTLAPFELRDANGAGLYAMLAPLSWAEPERPRRVGDQRDALLEALAELLVTSDALLITGGVSAGDYDFVPEVLRAVGVEVLFHQLPIRPGRPVLGGVAEGGRPVFGLPGNPVSSLVTARLFAAPALRARAGLAAVEGALFIDVEGEGSAPPRLRHFPALRLVGPERGELVESRGSGDWVSIAGSDGFVEVPAGEPVRGRRRFYRWRLDDAEAMTR